MSLIIFIAVGATGTGFYVNFKAEEMADQSIEMLKANGFELSAYESLDIDYFEQSLTLKNLTIASKNRSDFKLEVGELRLDGIDPIGDLSIFVEKTMLKNIELTYFDQVYKFADITALGLKTNYQPHFGRILTPANMADRFKILHQELDYDQLSFTDFSQKDKFNNVSRIADGSYSKQALVNDLPSQWRVHFTGLEISQAHLPALYAQLLRDYELKDLNGILDISFDYQKPSRTAVMAINNLNFGGMANLQSDLLVSMTDERFESLYELNDFNKNINTLPIEHAEILYNDSGLYNHVVTQQAPKLGLSVDGLRTQIRFSIALISAGMTDLERRLALATPFTQFIDNPAGLKIELSPAKPVRFQQYLNVYDVNVLVRDLNPSVEYLN